MENSDGNVVGDVNNNEKTQSTCDSVSAKTSDHLSLFASIPTSGLKCDILFLVIKNRIREEPEYVRRMRVVFQFNITKHAKPAATWTCDTRTSIEGDVYRAPSRLKVDCELTVDDDDWVKIMVGKLNPQRAFMMSKFKVRGNIMLLQKLHSIWFDLRRKGKINELDLIQDVMVSEPLVPNVMSEAMAIEIVQRVARAPHLSAKVDGTLGVSVLKNGRLVVRYSIGLLKGRKPEFARLFNSALAHPPPDAAAPEGQPGGRGARPTVELTMEDEDFVLLLFGVRTIDGSVAAGKLAVSGDDRLLDRAKILFEQPPILARL